MNRIAGLVAIWIAIAALIAPALGQPFNPTRKLTTWYTDRSLIDIEIVGSTSMLPDRHRLEPDRVLRFRLERAYVGSLLTKDKPGFEIVLFSFDIETGLPDSLFDAVASKGKYHEDIPGVPIIPFTERIKRTLSLSLESDYSAAALYEINERLRTCQGANLENGLIVYEWQGRNRCHRTYNPKGVQYLAQFADNLLLEIECHDVRLGCSMRFPFEGFAVKIKFNGLHLMRWRDMIERATAFLKSKQYH